MEYRYFLVKGGAVLAAIDRFFARRNAQFDARQKFVEEFGGNATYANSRRVVGLQFLDGATVPKGWRRVKGERDVYRPHGNGKEARSLRKRMEALPLDDAYELQQEVQGKDCYFLFMVGMSVRFMGTEKVGEHRILKVPALPLAESERELVKRGKSTWQPPDDGCVELKMSEYWKLKEDAEAAVGA